MKIVVASKNPAKIWAVREAFAVHFPEQLLEVEGVSVSSDVSDQPMGDLETQTGARNRVASAQKLVPSADYWVGLEGGVQHQGDYLMAFAWMCIRDSHGKIGESRSMSLPLPPKVRRLVDSGLELGAANDQVFATTNSKQKGGAYGLLTGGILTRESVYRDTLVTALVPLINPIYQRT